MKIEITPQIRAALVQALLTEEINLRDLGYSLCAIDGQPATDQEKEDWAEFRYIHPDDKPLIRKALIDGFVDLDKLLHFPDPIK